MMIAFVFESVKVIKICKGAGREILQSHIPTSKFFYENTASRHFFIAFPNLLGCFQKNNALSKNNCRIRHQVVNWHGMLLRHAHFPKTLQP